ncbi:dienelactone hydrolase family protein [bacterium]|nr:MAG: dienelactone hydrolase family protein [bacterium]
MRTLISLILLVFCASLAFGAVETREVSYTADGVTLKGYLAKPEGAGKRPGVLVVHEWWGLNGYAKMRARKVAELGYVALAVDMYGDGMTTTDPKVAGEMSGKVGKNPALGMARFKAGMDFLTGDPSVDTGKIAAIGYCFGGTTVLTAARAGLDLRGVVSFHGSLAPVGEPAGKNIKAKVLVCHGGADTFITPAQFDGFLKEMADSGAEWQVNVYGKAKHSFTNPASDAVGMPSLGYNKTADERSWAEMVMFLKEVLEM